jgi:hypothetical protein
LTVFVTPLDKSEIKKTRLDKFRNLCRGSKGLIVRRSEKTRVVLKILQEEKVSLLD